MTKTKSKTKTKLSSEYEVLERLVLAFQENAPLKNTTKKDQLAILAQGVRALEGEYDVLRAKVKMEIDKVDKKTLYQVQRSLDLSPDANTDTTVDALLGTLDSLSSRHLEAKLGKGAHAKRYEKLRIGLAPFFLVQKDQDILLPIQWIPLQKYLPGFKRLVLDKGVPTIKFLLFLALKVAYKSGRATPYLLAMVHQAYQFCLKISPDLSPLSLATAVSGGAMSASTAVLAGGVTKALGSDNLCYNAVQGICVGVSMFDTRVLSMRYKIFVVPMQEICRQLGFWDSLQTFKRQIDERKAVADDVIAELKKDPKITDKERNDQIAAVKRRAEWGLVDADIKIHNEGHRRLRGKVAQDKARIVDGLRPDHPARSWIMKKHNIAR